jgi:putative PIN family toxin of toxin-antitoxin system
LNQSQKRRGCRVVVDTSVVISGISAFQRPFVPGKSSSGDLLYEWVQSEGFIWLVTAEILEEYKEVARRLNVRPNVAGRLINLLREEAEEVAVEEIVDISPDPGDNCFCGCAEVGRADFLVTLNSRDFPQKKLSAKVVSPAEFLKRMRHRQRVQ